MKKILLAGPGTGKTTKVKRDLLSGVKDFNRVLVLSFTNATVNDLISSFARDSIPIDERNCITLHSYALKVNHRRDLHITNSYEEKILRRCADSVGVEFRTFCEMLSCITYEQMITDLVDFAKINPTYFEEKVGDIDLLIVDEYQDFNDIEQQLVHLIAGRAADTLILGDDDQCIYDFKDASSDGIIALYKDSAVEKISHKNICYRCPDIVVEKASNLIKNNKKRVQKDWNPNQIEGSIVFQQYQTMTYTVRQVVQSISDIRNTSPDESILVLAPVGAAVEMLPDALETANIPFLNFFNDPMDFDTYQLIWRLRLVYTRYQLLNLILLVYSSDLSDYKKQKFRTLLKKHVAKDFSFSKMKSDLNEFIDADVGVLLESRPDFDSLISQEPWIALRDYLSEVEGETAEAKIEGIEKYVNPPLAFNREVVNIMSIHKSKGLEADNVFILGLVDGILPRETSGVDSIEEQRRMFFVAITRTKKKLYLLSTVRWDAKHVHQLGKAKFSPVHANSRLYNARTSPFIGELNL